MRSSLLSAASRLKLGGAGLALLLSSTVATASGLAGSSSQSPYVVGVAPGVVTKAILTVGDSVNNKPDGTPYRMVGIPDGLGAFDNKDGTFTLLMNHELVGAGIVRAHGATGAFVSKWIIRKNDLTVLSGQDLIQNIATWNAAAVSYNAPAQGITLARLCSANLAPISAFYDENSGVGYNGHLFMDGEESGTEGRAFGHAMDGTSYELPRLGKMAFENAVANPGLNDDENNDDGQGLGGKTVVISQDDGTGGQVYIYVGDKTSSGSPVDQAGLTNGRLFGLTVTGYAAEPAAGIPSGTPFTAYDFGNVESWTGAQLEAASVANSVTTFQRPEDGAWDPKSPNDYYFVTTASFTGPSRLWRLRFNNPADPAAGGTLSMLLDGSEGQKMLDNITVNLKGQLVLQEDPGNQAHVAKLWRYDVDSDTLEMIAQHDPARFAPGGANFLTQDEESSGVIDMSMILGKGWVLLDVQAHYNRGDAELVEGGQLLAMYVPKK